MSISGINLKSAIRKAGFTQEEAAGKLNVSRQTLSSWFRYGTIPQNIIDDVKTLLSIDLEDNEAENDSVLTKSAALEPPTNSSITKSNQAVPVYDVQFSAGTLLNLVELRDTNYPIAWLNIPEVAGCDAVIRARGKSMEPLINDGDWIGLKQEQHWREWLPKDYVYAISTSTMMLTKFVRKTDDEFLYIASANPEYSDDKIPKKFIYDVWSVKTILPFSKIQTLI